MSATRPSTQVHDRWPTQLVLPGQAAAPEGPVDMAMMYLSHHGFRRDLTRFVEAAKATPVEDRRTWRALSDRWALFAEVLHNHHGGEDAGLWPWLRERADAQEQATLDAMEAEHEQIDPLLEACAYGFARLAERGDEDTRAAMVVRLTGARNSLGRHLAHEETDAIAMVQRLMTAEEWEQLDKEHFQSHLTPRFAMRVVPWAAHGLPQGVRDRLFAQAGLPMKVVWLLTRRGFERRERVAFGYARGLAA